MNTRFTIFAFVVSACFVFIGHANMYADWAQQSAINLQPEAISYAAANAIADNIRRKQNIETALKNNAAALPRPNVGLISSDEVSGYPYVDRYLTELGDKDISHYYILRKDYKFQDLSGGNITIPAGFIWDGASIPTGLLGKVIELVALEVGNTRYNSALSEGLIHDYMYRDPRRFSQEDADDLLYVNLVRCGNADPKTIYKGVQARGGESYQGHKRRQDQGLYDVFTPEFYAENLKTFHGGNVSSLKKKQTVQHSLDRKTPDDNPDLSGQNLADQSGKVAVKDGPLGSCKTTDVAVVVREKDTSQVGVRGWCTCGEEHGKIYQCGVGAFIPGFNLGDYVYELCARCGKILKPNKTDKEAKIFDMRIDRKYRGDSGLIGGIPLHKYEALLKQAENKLLDIPDGEIVIRGTCVCKEPDPIHVGFLDWGYSPYVCILCGRVRLPDKDGSIPNGPTALSEMGLDKQAESARERMLECIEHNR